MDPFTQMLIGSLISGGLGFLGGAVGGGGQELESFTGTPDTDPIRRLARAIQEIKGLSDTAKGVAGEPVRLRSAFAQQPPTFSDGGLPMPIGLTGVDPALADPSLLELSGIDFGEDYSTRGGDSEEGLGGGAGGPGRNIPAIVATASRRRRARGDANEAAAALQFLL